MDEVDVDHYTILGDDPTSAKVVCTRDCTITYYARTKQPIKTTTSTTSVMTSDAESFILTNTLVTKIDGVDFFTKTWKESIPRNGV